MEQIQSVSNWLPSLVSAAVLGVVVIACHIDSARESNERQGEQFDAMREFMHVMSVHRQAERDAQEAFIAEQTVILQRCINRSAIQLTRHVTMQAAHTDDTIQRVLTRPEARVNPMGANAIGQQEGQQ